MQDGAGGWARAPAARPAACGRDPFANQWDAVDQVGAAQQKRVAADAEQPRDGQPDRVRPVRRARGEEADLGAAKRRRVHLGLDLCRRLVGGHVGAAGA